MKGWFLLLTILVIVNSSILTILFNGEFTNVSLQLNLIALLFIDLLGIYTLSNN